MPFNKPWVTFQKPVGDSLIFHDHSVQVFLRFHHFDKTHIVPKDAEDLLDNKLGEGEGFVVCDIWRPTRVIQCSVRSSKSKEFSKTMDITSS
ncbi:unnamed protein product [Prunus armeniaca]|uniref:Uncharacterized protein n=1 Tax=Prunus armeniaca TaxID=36596 RepID=A0A6J5WHL8_PRUAR|nr:unnamed protein product [Prunus armeniaca]